MRTAELYKLRTHRNPLLCAAALIVGVLIPSVVLIWYTPDDPATYTDAYVAAFEVLSLLLAVVFGGWLLGTEYRQGTVKRLLTGEPRRLRALGVKALVGAAAMAAVLAVGAGIGWGAARVVGTLHDAPVAWEGRALLAFGVTAFLAATVAFSLSAVTRSDTIATIGTVALIVMIEPLLSLVPRVGDYTLGAAVGSVEAAIGDTTNELATLSAAAAALTLVVWLVPLVVTAAALFARRDV